MGHSSHQHRAIESFVYEHYQIVIVFIVQIKLSIEKAMEISSSTKNGANKIYIAEMELTNITVTENVISITIINSNNQLPDVPCAIEVKIVDSSFTKINGKHGPGTVLAISSIYGLAYSNIS